MKTSITTKRSSQVINQFKKRKRVIPKLVDSDSDGEDHGNGQESQKNQGDTHTQNDQAIVLPLEPQAGNTERDSSIIGNANHKPPPAGFIQHMENALTPPAEFAQQIENVSTPLSSRSNLSPPRSPRMNNLSPTDTHDENHNQNSFVQSSMNDSGDASGMKRRKYWVNELIKQAIDFYEAKDGYGFQELQKRYKPTESGKIYLGEGKEVDPLSWRLIQVGKPTVFLRDLIGILWEPYDLCNRAICLELVSVEIKNRSPVKEIEQGLLFLLISLYNEFLEKQKRLSEEQKIRYLKQTTNVLSQRIRDLRSEQKREKGASSRARRLFEN